MNRPSSLLLAGLLSSFAAFAQTPAGNAAPTRPTATVVAVFDPVKVIDQFPKAAAGLGRLKQQRDAVQEQVDKAKRRFETVKLERDGLKPGSRERAEKDIELQVMLKEFELRERLFDADLDQKRDEILAAIYEDIEKAVAAVAKARGVDVVLRLHPGAAGDGSATAKTQIFERREVWYAADAVDLTPAIVKWLQVELPPEPKDGPKDAAGDKGTAPTVGKSGNNQ